VPYPLSLHAFRYPWAQSTPDPTPRGGGAHPTRLSCPPLPLEERAPRPRHKETSSNAKKAAAACLLLAVAAPAAAEAEEVKSTAVVPGGRKRGQQVAEVPIPSCGPPVGSVPCHRRCGSRGGRAWPGRSLSGCPAGGHRWPRSSRSPRCWGSPCSTTPPTSPPRCGGTAARRRTPSSPPPTAPPPSPASRG
jgi:hypothetical protein